MSPPSRFSSAGRPPTVSPPEEQEPKKKRRGFFRRKKKDAASDDSLRRSVGKAPKPPKPSNTDGKGSSGRGRLVALILAVAAIAGVITLSYLNSQDYYMVCHAERISAEKGRLLPWGKSELEGPQWRAIRIPPEATCTAKTYSSQAKLEKDFLKALVTQAKARLESGEGADVEEADTQLKQALLLTREGGAKRRDVERLLGDLEFWRGRATMKEVAATLKKAERLYDSAAEKGMVGAATWSAFAKELEKELELGPKALRPEVPVIPTITPPSARDAGTGSTSNTTGNQGGSEPVPVPKPEAPVDAGVAPRGGVLL